MVVVAITSLVVLIEIDVSSQGIIFPLGFGASFSPCGTFASQVVMRYFGWSPL